MRWRQRSRGRQTQALLSLGACFGRNRNEWRPFEVRTRPRGGPIFGSINALTRREARVMRMQRPRVRSLRLQAPAVGCSLVLRPGATRVAGTEPHAAKLPYKSVVAAGDPASKAGGIAKRSFPYWPLRDGKRLRGTDFMEPGPGPTSRARPCPFFALAGPPRWAEHHRAPHAQSSGWQSPARRVPPHLTMPQSVIPLHKGAHAKEVAHVMRTPRGLARRAGAQSTGSLAPPRRAEPVLAPHQGLDPAPRRPRAPVSLAFAASDADDGQLCR